MWNNSLWGGPLLPLFMLGVGIILIVGVAGAPVEEAGKEEGGRVVGKRWVDQGVGIQILQLPPDCSYRSQTKDILTTEYVGKFLNGTKFDSTYDRNMSMIYTLGQGEVIQGCEIGTTGMCKGEKRLLIIPPHLAYGDQEYGIIPPNTTLTFEIELTDLQEDPFRAFDIMEPFPNS